MSNLGTFCDQIEKLSLIGVEGEGGPEFDDLEELLLELASRLRGEDISYVLVVEGLSESPFRLRSQNPPGPDSPRTRFTLPETGLRITVVLDERATTFFEGLVRELQLLATVTCPAADSEGHLVTDVKLLNRGAFLAELRNEYACFEERGTPFWVARTEIASQVNRRDVARELKHVASSRDKLGVYRENLLVSFYPSREKEDDVVSKLAKRLRGRYSRDEVDFSASHLPSEMSSWKNLESFLENGSQ